MCCGNSILQKGLPFFYLHKIFYTLEKYCILLYKIQTVDKSCSKLVTRAWNSFLSTSFRIFEQKNKGSLPFHSQV
ncbi:hypothetical protein FIU33_15955, partial [Enterococcus faecium]